MKPDLSTLLTEYYGAKEAFWTLFYARYASPILIDMVRRRYNKFYNALQTYEYRLPSFSRFTQPRTRPDLRP